MNKKLISLCLFCLSLSLFSQSGEFSPQFSRTSWVMGLESFTGDLPERYEYLKTSLPDLIKKQLDQVDVHILTNKEIQKYRESLYNEERLKVWTQLQKAIETRDNLLFSGENSSEKLKESEAAIVQLKASLEKIEEFSLDSIQMPEMLPLSWNSSSGSEKLLEPGQYSPQTACRINDLDYLISGEMRQIEGYFKLDILGYDPSTDKLEILFSSAGSVDIMDQLATEAADELRSLILGRPWTALKVSADDPDALIYCNGDLLGVGTAESNILHPGLSLLEAVGRDNSYWSEEIDLIALEHFSLEAVLSESEKEFITLATNPEGADVYIGARWAGTSPLSLPRYKEKPIWVTVRSEGFYEESFEISNETEDELTITLEEESITRLEDFDNKKKDFYRSLGRFSLSVGAPIITAGVQSNYVHRQNAYASLYLETSEQEYYDLAYEMERNYYISTGVLIGTIGVSSGLLVDVFVKLARYIRAAEALAQ